MCSITYDIIMCVCVCVFHVRIIEKVHDEIVEQYLIMGERVCIIHFHQIMI